MLKQFINVGTVVGLMLATVATVGVITDCLVHPIRTDLLKGHLWGLLTWSAEALVILILIMGLYWQKGVPFHYFGMLMTMVLLFIGMSFFLIVRSLGK